MPPSEYHHDGILAIDWIAEWRDPELADLGSNVLVRIGASGDVYQLHWDARDANVQEGRVVRLRPVSEFLADPEVWREGDITGDLSRLAGNLGGPPLDLRIPDVSLEQVPPFGSTDQATRFAVPVYAFRVEVNKAGEVCWD